MDAGQFGQGPASGSLGPGAGVGLGVASTVVIEELADARVLLPTTAPINNSASKLIAKILVFTKDSSAESDFAPTKCLRRQWVFEQPGWRMAVSIFV